MKERFPIIEWNVPVGDAARTMAVQKARGAVVRRGEDFKLVGFRDIAKTQDESRHARLGDVESIAVVGPTGRGAIEPTRWEFTVLGHVANRPHGRELPGHEFVATFGPVGRGGIANLELAEHLDKHGALIEATQWECSCGYRGSAPKDCRERPCEQQEVT